MQSVGWSGNDTMLSVFIFSFFVFCFCSNSVLLTCGKRLVGVLPSLVNHGQDKELHVRLAALQVWTNYTCPKISEFWFSAEPVL